MEYIILVMTGFLAGVIGTIIGAGGGFLVVPYLLLVKGFSSQLAVGTSLTMVFFNALSGTMAYAKQKRIDYDTAWKFALATLPGSVIGAYASRYLAGRLFEVIFGIFIATVATQILIRSASGKGPTPPRKTSPDKKGKIITDSYGNSYTVSYNTGVGLLTSFGVGFLASILGIGGGLIHVPVMIYVLGYPAHLATATSHLVLTISSFIGSASHLYLGNVQIATAALLALGAITGAQVGARLARKLKEQLIIRVLALALFFLTFRLLVG